MKRGQQHMTYTRHQQHHQPTTPAQVCLYMTTRKVPNSWPTWRVFSDQQQSASSVRVLHSINRNTHFVTRISRIEFLFLLSHSHSHSLTKGEG